MGENADLPDYSLLCGEEQGGGLPAGCAEGFAAFEVGEECGQGGGEGGRIHYFRPVLPRVAWADPKTTLEERLFQQGKSQEADPAPGSGADGL